MTNREWVNNMTDEEFADWCCNEEIVDWSTGRNCGITPKLRTIKMSYTSSEGGLRIWLKQERSESI